RQPAAVLVAQDPPQCLVDLFPVDRGEYRDVVRTFRDHRDDPGARLPALVLELLPPHLGGNEHFHGHHRPVLFLLPDLYPRCAGRGHRRSKSDPQGSRRPVYRPQSQKGHGPRSRTPGSQTLINLLIQNKWFLKAKKSSTDYTTTKKI